MPCAIPREQQLSNLPTELLQHVAGYLEIREISCFSRLSRRFHYCFFHLLFDSAIETKRSSKKLQICLVDLFFHACSHTKSTNSVRTIVFGLLRECTFLHFALLSDAPKVAAALMKNGSDLNQDMEDYPDLTPLYLVLPRSLVSSRGELDTALRIACSYALPRTAGFLLERGADVNRLNKYGLAAIHYTVMRRKPWRHFMTVIFLTRNSIYEGMEYWELNLLQTVRVLLNFGTDINLLTQTSRDHICSPSCWRSIDCDHPAQTVLHMASAAGVPSIVSHLLEAGANPNLPDGQGYTALYGALVQGHKEIVRRVLEASDDCLNPIVNVNDDATALHIASRFCFPEMVDELLSHGAYSNVVDAHGRTPLHEVLLSALLERKNDVIQTLRSLVEFQADMDTVSYSQTPRQLAETHSFSWIKDALFSPQDDTWIPSAKQSSKFYGQSPSNYVPISKDDWQTSHFDTDEYFEPVKVSRFKTCFKAWQVPPELLSPQDFPELVEADAISQTDLANPRSGDSTWAPHKTAELVQSFESDNSNPSFESAQPIFVRPVMKEANPIPAPIVTAKNCVWSESTTSRLIKDLQKPALPPRRAQKLEKPVEAFPALDQTGSAASPVSAEAAQLWGEWSRRINTTGKEATSDGSEKAKGSGPEIAYSKAGRSKKKRWAPLQL